MKKSDKERLKKIVSTWNSLKEQMGEHGITPEMLLTDGAAVTGLIAVSTCASSILIFRRKPKDILSEMS